MPKGSRTTIFVSSTCYDLAQLRADIRDFAETLGLEPILSEFDTFPVDPAKSTVENCLDIVRTRADIFLLVVGNRYGSLAEAGRSVTNLEYFEASARAIPRYVFVKSNLLALLPVWKSNPTADFSTSVDSPKLFEFVAHLRDSGSVWVFPFDTAQDIIATLRKQLSYLFADCLNLRAKLGAIDHESLSLGPESLRIYMEKPAGWEYLVFAKLLQERVEAHKPKRLDLELELAMGEVLRFDDIHAATRWVSMKFHQITQINGVLTKALNNGIEKAVGAPGEPGDIVRIEHLASRISDAYAQMLDWTLEFHRVDTDPSLERLMQLASHFSSNAIREIEEYSSSLYDRIKSAIETHKPGDIVHFTLTAPDVSEFKAEMEQIGQLL